MPVLGIDIRLLPNHLCSENDSKPCVTSKYAAPIPSRLFYGYCHGWVDVGQFMFAGVLLGRFVVDVEDEKAAVVQSLSLWLKTEGTLVDGLGLLNRSNRLDKER